MILQPETMKNIHNESTKVKYHFYFERSISQTTNLVTLIVFMLIFISFYSLFSTNKISSHDKIIQLYNSIVNAMP